MSSEFLCGLPSPRYIYSFERDLFLLQGSRFNEYRELNKIVDYKKGISREHLTK
jgi:hypothetical protein